MNQNMQLSYAVNQARYNEYLQEATRERAIRAAKALQPNGGVTKLALSFAHSVLALLAVAGIFIKHH